MKKISTFLFVIFAFGCASGGSGDFLNPKALAVDSVNDRAFFIEADQQIFVRQASTNAALGDQPMLDEDEDADADLLALVPELTTQALAFPDGDVTRLFLLGGNTTDDGDTVLQQMVVLDFDGDGFSVDDLSPIALDDGDETTDESQDSFVEAVLDVERAQIFVLNATIAEIFVISAETGENLVAPIPVANAPVDLSLDGERLYVCHNDAALTEQVTVVNVVDYTTQTFALGFACQNIAVLSNATGTVFAAKRDANAALDLYALNTDDFTLTAIATDEEDFTDGQLVSGAGFSSTIATIALTKDADDNVQGYFAEQDGNVEVVTIASDLSLFTHQTISTSALNYLASASYVDGDGVASRTYFIAESGAVLSVVNTDGELDSDLDN